MRFNRRGHYQFADTRRKRLAIEAKRRREREAQPLLQHEIAIAQRREPGADEIMAKRAIGHEVAQREDRESHAARWRKARKRLHDFPEHRWAAIRKLWNECPYPGSPEYLNCLLQDLETGRVTFDKNPPWKPTDEEIRIGREKIAAYQVRLAEARAQGHVLVPSPPAAPRESTTPLPLFDQLIQITETPK